MVKLCVEYGCTSIGYFLDVMQPYELYPILSNLHLKVKGEWERTRNIMYAVCQSQSTKHLKVTDIEQMKNEAIKHKEEYINSGLIEK